MQWPRVNPGDPLAVPASLQNATIECVEAYLRNKRATGGRAVAQRPHQALILIRNDTGADLAAGGIVGLDKPVWPGYVLAPAPGTNLSQWLGAEMLFLGVAPDEDDHAGKFAVAVEPILSGAVGRACVQGMVKVKVAIADLDVAEWADVTDASTAYLTAASTGSARILWYEGAAPGTLWCVCLLGASAFERTPTGEAPTRNFAFRAHIDYPIAADNAVFWSIPGVLDSMIWIDAELRACVGNGAEGAGDPPAEHPGFKAAVLRSISSCQEHRVTVGALGDDAWIGYTLSVINAAGAVSTYATGGDPEFQLRVTAAGTLEFRIYSVLGGDIGTDPQYILSLAVRILDLPTGMDMAELGTGQVGTFGGIEFTDHEMGIPADPDIDPDPPAYPWGDGMWRHV